LFEVALVYDHDDHPAILKNFYLLEPCISIFALSTYPVLREEYAKA